MILSDTIYYRADGTVSSVQRVSRETFTKPSGAEAFEDVTSEVQLSALDALLNPAYGAMDAHNKSLEAQIVELREQVEEATARATEAEAKLTQIASMDRQYDEIVKPLLGNA